eukprot:5057510-Amphidinium_carterae.1
MVCVCWSGACGMNVCGFKSRLRHGRRRGTPGPGPQPETTTCYYVDAHEARACSCSLASRLS